MKELIEQIEVSKYNLEVMLSILKGEWRKDMMMEAEQCTESYHASVAKEMTFNVL